MVRVMIGEPSGATETTTVTVIEANIDDASPQLIGYTMELLLEAGRGEAAEAFVHPGLRRPEQEPIDAGRGEISQEAGQVFLEGGIEQIQIG